MKIGTMISAKDAFKAGLNKSGFQVIEIDPQQFTEQERELIVEECTLGNAQSEYRDRADFHICSSKHCWPELTAERVKELASKWAKEEAELQAKKAKFLADFFALSDDQIADKFLGYSTYSCSYMLKQYEDFTNTIKESKEAMEVVDRIISEKNKERQEHNKRVEEEHRKRDEELQKKQEEARAKRLAEEERLEGLLKSWAMENGSDLLKERIAGGFEWVKLAQNEYADIEFTKLGLEKVDIPFDEYETDTEERTTPTLEEIKALKHAKAIMPNADIKLIWCKYINSDYDSYGYDEDGEDEKASQCELEVSIKCPNEAEKTRYFKPIVPQ